MHKYTYRLIITLFFLFFFFSGCSKHSGPAKDENKVKACFENGYDDKNYRVTKNSKIEIGYASYYAKCFHGGRTANGEICDLGKHTAAHRSLPFGTMVRVTMLQNEKCVIVKINDRGLHVKSRVIDLSIGAAKKLGLIRSGITKVKIEKLEKVDIR